MVHRRIAVIGPGLLLHKPFSRRWTVTVGFAAGYYEREHGPRLGSVLEFISSLEFSRAIAHEQRIGVSVEHISNGSIDDENPGTETIRLFWMRVKAASPPSDESLAAAGIGSRGSHPRIRVKPLLV